MAESGKITREDIIAKDAFTTPVDEAKELLKVITDIQNALKTKAKQSTEGFAIASPQTLDDVAKLTKQIEDLKKQIAALEAITEKQKKATKELTAAQAEENLARQKQRQEVTQQVKLQSELTSTYEKQVVRLAQIKKELKTLSTEGKQAPEELLNEFKKLDGSVRKAEESVNEFHRSIGNYSSATAELKDLTKQLIDLERAGQRDTAAFREMRKRAAELKDTISDTKAEIKNMASDTKTIDGLVGSVNLLANGFQVAEGAMALMGKSGEEWKETMVKLQAIMAVTSGIQEIQNALQKESAAMMFLNSVRTKAAAALQTAYAFATGGATIATKAFRIALISTGIGAIVVLLGSLADAMGFFDEETEKATDTNNKLNQSLKKTERLLMDYQEVLGHLDAGVGVENIAMAELKNTLSELEKQLDEYEAKPIIVLPIEDETPEQTKERIAKIFKSGKEQILKDIDAVQKAIDEKEKQIAKDRARLGLKGPDADLANRQRAAELIDNERQKALKKEDIRYQEEYKKAKANGEKLSLVNQIHRQNRLKINTDFNKKEADEFDRREAERKAKEKKEQQEALDLEQEKLSGKIDIKNEEQAILLEANKENYTAIKTAIDEEYNLKAEKLEKQKVFELSNKDLTENEKLLIEEKYKNDSLALAREKAAELKGINEKEKEDKKKLKADELAEERKVQQQVLQGIEQGTKRRSEIVQNGLNAEIKKQDEAVQRQQELAAKGLDNTLAYQEKKREELQAKLEREREAERKREEALQLAGAFLGSYQRRLDDKQKSPQALAGALADTLIAKAISSTIAGAFAEGVENFQGKGTGTSDSNLIAFSHGESVVTAKATQQYSGLVTAMNKGLVDEYVKQMILPDMDAPKVVNAGSFQSAAIVYTLTKELGELKQAIKNKQEIKVNWNAQGERVEEIVKDGMKTVIKHVTTGKRRL